ncbi:hypothetical protein [Fictibacillus sp. JL2B1089]|uniref:hypothetical protein n=1 Tax=Fictibacillus sp. JL2B1089 TaxID=3399565 RepID=UPI003A83A90A
MDINDINWSSSNKFMDLGKIYTDSVIDSIRDEQSRFQDVKMNLRDQAKLKDEEINKLDELIRERNEKLMEYAKEKHETKKEALTVERDRAVKVIQDYAEEARTQ